MSKKRLEDFPKYNELKAAAGRKDRLVKERKLSHAMLMRNLKQAYNTREREKLQKLLSSGSSRQEAKILDEFFELQKEFNEWYKQND